MTVGELRGVSFVRGGNAILRDIDWTIGAGEHWALLGANGSGKTTLLKIITGYEWPTRGSVTVLGNRFGDCDLREARKAIGWVSSALEHRVPRKDTALDVALSGLESSLGLYREYSAEEKDRAREALDAVGAGWLEAHLFATLSQGEQQRVIIARALVAKPRLLILDEACAGLDPAAREDFLNDVARLVHTPHAPTLIYVTHHVEEIGGFVNRAMVLGAGRVVAQGPTGHVLTGTVMSEAFRRPVDVRADGGRYYLRMLETGTSA